MRGEDVRLTGEVGNRPGDPEDAVVGARGQMQADHGLLQELPVLDRETAEPFDPGRLEARVQRLLSSGLPRTGRQDLLADRIFEHLKPFLPGKGS